MNVPDPIIRQVRNSYLYNLSRCVAVVNLIHTILKMFHTNGISALPIKGPVLSEYVYGDMALRMFSDIDILIPFENVLLAMDLLVHNGYTPEIDLTRERAETYIRHEYECSFVDPKNHIVIELHWNLAANYLKHQMDYNFLQHFLSSFAINEKNVLFLSPEMLFVYQCVHGCKHEWDNMESIYTISKLMLMDIKWHVVEETARKYQCRRMILLGMMLCSTLFDSPIPTRFVNLLQNDKMIERLSDSILIRILSIHNSNHLIPKRFSFFHIMIREGWKDKLWYGIRLMFKPTRNEWIDFPVPASLSYVYYFLRPFRLLMRYFSNLIRFKTSVNRGVKP